MHAVSSVIPRKVRKVAGSSSFSDTSRYIQVGAHLHKCIKILLTF